VRSNLLAIRKGTKCTPTQRATKYLKRVVALTGAKQVCGESYRLTAGRMHFLLDSKFVRVISPRSESTCFSVAADPDMPSAEVVLSAMMGAVATVLALIFSVALLVLSMVSTLFGPRLLYRFLQDWVTIRYEYKDNNGKPYSEEITKRLAMLGINQFEFSNLNDADRTDSWFDYFNNAPLLSAFVTRMDDHVKQITLRASTTMAEG
jgi:hypothetical protein